LEKKPEVDRAGSMLVIPRRLCLPIVEIDADWIALFPGLKPTPRYNKIRCSIPASLQPTAVPKTDPKRKQRHHETAQPLQFSQTSAAMGTDMTRGNPEGFGGLTIKRGLKCRARKRKLVVDREMKAVLEQQMKPSDCEHVFTSPQDTAKPLGPWVLEQQMA
jgi:hypothetical protein